MNNFTNFPQIAPFLKELHKGPLEQQIKQKYTPFLFQNVLVERCSWQGVASDFIRQWTPLDPEKKRWKTLFRDFFAQLSEQSLQGLPASEQNALYALKWAHAKKSTLQQQPADTLKLILQAYTDTPKEKTQKRSNVSVHWTNDPQQLRALSLLRSGATEADPTLDRDVLQALFGCSEPASSEETTPLLRKLAAHIQQKFAKEQASSLDFIGPAIDQALSTEKALQQCIEKARGSENTAPFLDTLAKQVSDSVAALTPGKKCLVIGGIPEQAPELNISELSTNPTCKLLEKILLDGEMEKEVDKFLEQFFASLDQHSLDSLLPETFESTVKALLKEGFVAHFLPKLSESLVKEDQNPLQKAIWGILDLARYGTKEALYLAEKMLLESVGEQISEIIGEDFLPELKNAFLEKRLQDTAIDLAKTKAKTLRAYTTKMRKSILANITTLSSQLPPQACSLIKALKFGDLGAPEIPLWFEVSRQPNGKLTLLIYATGATAALLGAIPLRYKDLTEEQLNSDFFLRLFLYRAEPECNQKIKYTIKGLFEGLIASLESTPLSPEGSIAAFNRDSANTTSPWGHLKAFLTVQLNFSSQKERELYFYRWKKEALIKAWFLAQSSTAVEKASLLPIVRNASKALIDESLKLFKANHIDITELKEIYATTWEILEATAGKTTPHNAKARPKSRIVPPEITALFGHGNVTLIKRILIDILGPESEAGLNKICADFDLPEASPPEQTPLSTQERMIAFGKRSINVLLDATIGFNLTDITRPSTFSYIKITLTVARVALALFFPGFIFTHSLRWAVTYVAQAALFEIGDIFLPEQMKQLRRVTQRLQEWKMRLLAYATARILLDEEQQKALHAFITKWEGTLTHSGKLSWDVPSLSVTLPKPFKVTPYLPQVRTKSHTEENATVIRPEKPKSIEPITGENCTAHLLSCLATANKSTADVQDALKVIEEAIGKIKLKIMESKDSLGKKLTGEAEGSTDLEMSQTELQAQLGDLERKLSQAMLAYNPRRAVVYCVEQIRALPMPKSGEGVDCWSEVKDPAACLEAICALTSRLYSSFVASSNSRDQPDYMTLELRHECLISFYKTYAIADKLVRRCPESLLPKDFEVNPWALTRFKLNPAFQLINPLFLQEFNGICAYFGIDPDREYTDAETSGNRVEAFFSGSSSESYIDDQLREPILPDWLSRWMFGTNPRKYTDAETSGNRVEAFFSGSSAVTLPVNFLWNNAPQTVKETIENVPKAINHTAINHRLKALPDSVSIPRRCFSEPELLYYLKLLKLPAIQAKLKAHGIAEHAPLREKIGHLIADKALDPKNQELSEEAKALLCDQGKNPRCSLLPRPFRLLRHMNFFANEAASHLHDVSQNSVSASLDDPIIQFTEHDNSIQKAFRSISWGSWNLGEWAQKENGKSTFTRLPGNYAKLQKTGCQNASKRKLIAPLERKTGALDLPEMLFTRRNTFFTVLCTVLFNHMNHPRTTPEIINEASNFVQTTKDKKPIVLKTCLSSLPPSEREAIEMLWSLKDDQAVRTLAYFSQNINRLCKEFFFAVFEVLLLRGDLLDKQLQTDPHFNKPLGEFFKKAIAYLEQKVLDAGRLKETITSREYSLTFQTSQLLQLIEIGMYALAKAKSVNGEASKDFPDFTSLLLKYDKWITSFSSEDSEKPVIPRNKVAELLILPLFFVPPTLASQEEKKHACELFLHSLTLREVYPTSSMYSETVELWAPAIAETLDTDAEIRNHFLNSLLAADTPEFIDRKAEWTGAFPCYTSELSKITIDFFSRKVKVQSSQSSLEKEIRLLHLSRIFSTGKDSIAMTPKGNNAFHLREYDITITSNDSKEMEFRKIHDGRNFRWVHPPEELMTTSKSGNPITYWLEEGDRDSCELIALENGLFHSHSFLRKSEQNLYVVESEVPKEVAIDLENESHGLGLLSWFQPLSSITAVRSDGLDSQLKRISFNNLNLRFEINELNGKKRAVSVPSNDPKRKSTEILGYYICEEQLQEKKIPALENHANYLVLENSQGQHKVILTADNLKTATSSWLLEKMLGVKSSKWMDSQFSGVIESLLEGGTSATKKDSVGKYYVYSVDSNGRLASDSPKALLHILFYSLAQGNLSDGAHYLQLLENLGRRTQFSAKLSEQIQMLETVAMILNDSPLVQMALRLAACCEENRLIQGMSSAKKASSKTAQTLFLEWFTLQANYFRYYSEKENSPYFELNEYQELFILHAIAKKGEELVTGQTKNGLQKHLLSKIGPSTLAETLLMLPQISHRYTFLKCKYALSGEITFEPIKALAKEVIHKQSIATSLSPANSLPANLPKEVGLQTNMLEEFLLSFIPEGSRYVDIRGARHRSQFLRSCGWDQFLKHYRLALGQSSSKPIEGSPEAESFRKSREIFHSQIRDLEKTRCSSSPYASGFEFFRFACDDKYQDFFPEPEVLEALAIKVKDASDLVRVKVEKKFNHLLEIARLKSIALEAETKWESVPIHFTELTLYHLDAFFYSYYQLALERPPLAYAKGSEKEKEFLAKAKIFKKQLRLAHHQDPLSQALIAVLQTASKHPMTSYFGFMSPFPDPQDYEKILAKYCKEKNYKFGTKLLVKAQEQNTFMNALIDAVSPSEATKRKLSAMQRGLHKKSEKEENSDSHELRLFFNRIKKAHVAIKKGKWAVQSTFEFAKDKALTVAVNAGVSCLPAVLGLPISATAVGTALTGLWAYNKFQEYSQYATALKGYYNEVNGNGIAGKEHQEFEERNQKSEEALPAKWLNQYQDEDRALEKLGRDLLDAYFSPVDSARGPKQKIPLKPFTTTHAHPYVQKTFTDFNQSLEEYYARPEEEQLPTELRSLESYYQLNRQLEHSKNQLSTFLRAYKSKFFKVPRKRTSVDTRSDAEIIADTHRHAPSHLSASDSNLTGEMKFNALLQAFIANDEKKLLKYSMRQPEDLPKLKRQLYRYLIQATRLQQLQRAQKIQAAIDPVNLSNFEMQILVKQLSFELSRKRAYPLDGSIPTRLLRAYLAFEYENNVMLWNRQVDQLQRILLENHPKAILELATGTGKTAVGIPIASSYVSNGTQVINNIFPESLKKENVTDLAARSAAVGQATNSIAFSRDTPLDVDRLWALLRLHTRALDFKENLNCGKTDRQALELRFIEEAFHASKKKDLTADEESILWQLMQLLKFIRTKVRANFDEAHEVLRYNDELNHPLGEKKRVKKSYINVISECIKLLVAIPEIEQAIPLQSNEHTLCNPDDYEKKIKPLLAEQLADYRPFAIPPQHKKAFSHYLCGNLDENGKLLPIPEFIAKHRRLSEINMALGMLNIILPNALEEKVNVGFGTKGNPHGYAQPYGGKDSPILGSTFKNPHEAIAKTLMASLHVPLTGEEIIQLQSKMLEEAKQASQKKGIPVENTRPAQLFASWTKNRFTLTQKLDPKEIDPLKELLNAIYAPRMSHARLCKVPHIEYFTKNIGSNSQNATSMFVGFNGGTASPVNAEHYPAGTKVLYDKGTKGEFAHYIHSACSDDKIHTIDSTTPADVLSEILNTQFAPGSPMKALIDGGALLHGLSNEQVTDKILEHIKESRPDLKAVVYFNENNELVIKEHGKKAIALAASTIPAHERITYYDDIHGYGADVKQAIRAGGVVTIKEKSPFDKLMQNVGRMRGRETAEQTIDIALSKAVENLIPKSDPMKIRNILHYHLENEALHQSEGIYPSTLQKISDRIRRAILDAMINAPDVKTMLRHMRTFESTLITDTSDDPTVMYPLKMDCPTHEALKVYREQQYGIIATKTAIPWKEKMEIKAELEQIGVTSTLPPTVRTAVRNGKFHVEANDIGMAQHVSVSQTQNQQLNQKNNQLIHQENQQETEENQDLQLNLNNVVAPNWHPLRPLAAIWDDTVDYFISLDWWKVSVEKNSAHRTVEIYAVVDSMRHATDSVFREAANAFTGNMYWSNNLRGIRTNNSLADLLSHQQTPLNEILVMEGQVDGKETLMTCAISPLEAAFWRQRLAENRANPNSLTAGSPKIALFDLELNAIVSSSANAFDREALYNDPNFVFDIARWKFLAAHVNLQKGANDLNERNESLYSKFRKWIDSNGVEIMKEAFERIYRERGFADSENSDIVSLLSVGDEEAIPELM